MTGLLSTTSQDREIFIEVLRGFAILGIFIANLNSFNFYNESAHLVGPFLVPDFDYSISFFQRMFIVGKFYTFFN